MAMDGDSGVSEDGIIDLINWDNLLENIPEENQIFFDVEVDPSLFYDADPLIESSNQYPDSFSLSIGEMEELLMRDDDNNDKAGVMNEQNPEFCTDFLSDILLSSPVESDRSGELVDLSDEKNSNGSDEDDKIHAVQQNKNNSNNNEDTDDPISKKRKRKLRNRDAAVRSRDRKKMYLRDLEMKSRYYEAECKRLGMLLQCCFAENQALRLSLQSSKAFDASMTKQESAVLLMESLLLGSLLWFLGIICLLILPRQLQSPLEAVPLENVGGKNRGSLAPKKTGSKTFGLVIFQSFMMGKRCKASRSRMKPGSVDLGVLVTRETYLDIFILT